MAKPTLFRIGRFIRSIFVPTTVIITFSCLLTFIWILYQPTPGPGTIQQLGWQSWETISDYGLFGGQVATGSGGVVTPPSGDTPIGEDDHTVDWWNVTEPSSDNYDPASLPLDVWDPLMPHDTGLTELEVTQCWIDPFFIPWFTGDFCAPASTKEKDTKLGKWVLVDRNLGVQSSGFSFLNVHYRRTRRLDVPLINEIRVLADGQTPTDTNSPDETWRKAGRPLNPHGEKRFLWYRTGKMLRDMSIQEKRNLVTEIDVTFGDDTPWYGFEKANQACADANGKGVESVWLAYRRGIKPPPKASPLHFSHNGQFKIMQVADLHYSVSAGVCKDTVLSPCVAADNLTNTLLAHMLDLEKPDMVIFTGDQLNGQGTSWDSKSVLSKFAKAVTDRKLPWAAVFGNHDDEDGELREDLIKYMKGLPYSLVERGPKDIHGAGNYKLKVYSADTSMTHLLTLYFLDSGAYEKNWYDLGGYIHSVSYDWIHQDQIDWFLEESASISPIERPFHPDGGKDLGTLWKRQAIDQVTPTSSRLAKPNAMMFFHIPLEEAFGAADVNPTTGKPLDVGISDLEQPGNAKKQDGFFQKALLSTYETDHRAGGNAREVKVIANGHDHITENCRRIKGVWSCFGGGGSYAGYSRVGFDRRFRVYQISDYGETIKTYKRTEHDEVIDEQILVGTGAPPPYEGS